MTNHYTQAQLEYVQTHPDWRAEMDTLAAARAAVKTSETLFRASASNPTHYANYCAALDAYDSAARAASELQQRLAAQYQPATE